MNYFGKNMKNHKKISSDFNSKLNKKMYSTAIEFKQNNKIKENIVSNSIKKNYLIKEKDSGTKNYVKNNNISESNTRDSNKNILYNDFYSNEESKGDIDIYDKTSTNNLTSTAINNESILNNTNSNYKTENLCTPKSIKNNEVRDININNLIKKELNFQSIEDKNNSIYSTKKNIDYSSVYKSQSNKELKNNPNISSNTNNKNSIIQRCRHKQVKREIHSNNNSNVNRQREISHKALNSLGKRKSSINKEDKYNKNENEKRQHKISFEMRNTLKQNNCNNCYKKNISVPKTKTNKNNSTHNSKKLKYLSDIYSLKNKPYIKNSKSKIIFEDMNEIRESKEVNNKNKNNDYFKSSLINIKINRIKSPNLNNYTYSENNINNNNDCSNSIYNNLDERKTQYSDILSKEDININESKKLNNMNKKNNNKMSTTGNIKRQYKRIKNQITPKNRDLNNNLREKKEKENDLSFNEDDLDENTLSISKGKYIENKKCQTMINKVFHFKPGSNEIFNNFDNRNNINKMNYTNKYQTSKSIKKNSCNTIINRNYSNNVANNNLNIKNIEVIIKNNIHYNNLNPIRNIYNENQLKKCYTDVHIDNNKKTEEDEDNIKNQKYFPSENRNNSIKINKTKINNNKKRNIIMHKIVKYSKNNFKKHFFKIFQCPEFIEYLFYFCDIHLLNKICLLSKQLYIYMKPIIYSVIKRKIYIPNKVQKNLKIKRYLMQKYSTLSKLSPALMKKKYTDLKFENNHIYDVEIKKDLTRTFPDNILFKYGNNYYNKLYHVLTAFSNYNKNIGYAQGLNFVAAHIIFFFEDEIDEFIFLDALILKFELETFISITTSNKFFIKKLEDITKYIKQKLPKINNYLKEMKLNYEFFTTNWILTLFSNSMETKNLSYIWDFMIIFGWKFFRCFVASVLMDFENEILNAKQNNITSIMKNMLKNKKFNNNFQTIINKTIKMLVEEKDII